MCYLLCISILASTIHLGRLLVNRERTWIMFMDDDCNELGYFGGVKDGFMNRRHESSFYTHQLNCVIFRGLKQVCELLDDQLATTYRI